MQKEETMNKNGRRQFLKTALITSVAGVAASAGVASAATESISAETKTTKHSWEVPPKPIPDSQIQQTIETDIVVLGAGAAGIATAYAASSAGAKVIVIEKMKKFSARGLCNAAIGTKCQKEHGVNLNKDEIVARLVRQAGNRVHQQLVQLWADKSGEVFDHYIELGAANGIGVVLSDPYSISDLYTTYSTSHVFARKPGTPPSAGNENAQPEFVLLELLEKSAKEKGADFRYDTAAQQLIREANGRVTGLVAEAKGSGYIKFSARKGVVVATGGYGENPEMVEAWCPIANMPEIKAYTPVGGNTGDGFNMALWIGASLQNWPHPAIFHTSKMGIEAMTGNQSFLHVNRLGLRYENENVPNQNASDGRFLQPGRKAWGIFDAKYEKDHQTFKSGFDGPVSEPMKALEESVQNGKAFKAETIEELAKAIGVPADALKQTVDRYTELARKKCDEDFHKDSALMFTIEQSPFYAIPLKSHFMVTLGGLNVNPQLQVLDQQDQAIAGLYAVGNAAGNFFANEYPVEVLGLSHGRALTLGHVLGENLAKS
jgi:fumarate reductase flavoprotein subunit